MKYLKLFIVLLLAPIPGSAYAATSNWRRTILFVLSVFAAGLVYRLSGCGGPTMLLLGFAAFNFVWLASAIASVIHAWRNRSKLSVVKCIASCFLTFVFIFAGLKLLSPGNTIMMDGNHSMEPMIDADSFFYATKLSKEYAVGDLVVYSNRGHFSSGLICGVGGDDVEIDGEKIFLNGKATNCGDDRFHRKMQVNAKTQVPKSSVFVVKVDGMDSSILGALPKSDLRGKILFVLDDSLSGRLAKRWIDFYGPEGFLSAIY